MPAEQTTCQRCGWPGRACELDGLCLSCLLGTGRAREYAILTTIGHGPSGTSYLAQQIPTGRIVVCKMMHNQANESQHSAELDAFHHRLTNFRHPNAAGALDVGRTNNRITFIARPYVSGLNLHAYVARSRPDVATRHHMINSVEDVIRAAHAVGIVHGGLTPSNVLVQKDDSGQTVQVVDFAVRGGDVQSDWAAVDALRSTVL